MLGAVLEESDAFYEKAMDTLLGQVCIPKEPCERAKRALRKSLMKLQRDLLTDAYSSGVPPGNWGHGERRRREKSFSRSVFDGSDKG